MSKKNAIIAVSSIVALASAGVIAARIWHKRHKEPLIDPELEELIDALAERLGNIHDLVETCNELLPEDMSLHE